MDIILKYFPDITNRQKQQFSQLYELYSEWNTKINVISRKDIENLYLHHILHSLSIAKLISFNKGSNILDVGTGGGFPGIPLAILFPDANFYLVDSVGKKIKVVNEISKAIDLKNVKAEQIRAEQMQDKFDFIISRAVADIPTLYNWVKDKIRKKNIVQNTLSNGMLILKGGDLTEELQSFKKKATVYNINEFFTESYFVDKKIIYIKL